MNMREELGAPGATGTVPEPTAASGSATDGPDSSSMTSRAYARLRADILSGTLEPGSKLKVNDLRDHYALGAGPIREALSLLTSDYLVERIDQRGFRVPTASIEEFGELLKTRCWLEERALKESIRNGGRGWEAGIEHAIVALLDEPRPPTADPNASTAWEKRHKEFHMALIAACGSAFLIQFCKLLYDQNVRYRHLSRVSATPGRDIATEHEAIAEATLARNGDLANGLLSAHYTLTGSLLSQALHSTPETGDVPASALVRFFRRFAK